MEAVQQNPLQRIEERDKETAETLTSLATTVIAPVIGSHFTTEGARYIVPGLSATAIVSLKTRDIKRGVVAGAIVGGVALMDAYLGSVPAVLIGLGAVGLRTEYVNPGFFRRWFRI
ncbi:MAG: hypothetical protein FJZ59_06550 [Chlamydiae bacterium]|nr:hypothetical protein [Chlamydiota bacterium]